MIAVLLELRSMIRLSTLFATLLLIQILANPAFAQQLEVTQLTYLHEETGNTLFGQKVWGTHTEKLQMDCYRDSGAKRKQAALLLFHGGGFVRGHRSDTSMRYLATNIAAQGVTVFVCDYRTLGLREASLLKAGYAAAQDVRAAVRYVRRHAGTLGIDSENIAIGGVSAGGTAALAAGFLDEQDDLLGRKKRCAELYGELNARGTYFDTPTHVAAVFTLSATTPDLSMLDDGDCPLVVAFHAVDDSWTPYYSGRPKPLSTYHDAITASTQLVEHFGYESDWLARAKLPLCYGPAEWKKRLTDKTQLHVVSFDRAEHDLLFDRGRLRPEAPKIAQAIAKVMKSL